MSKISEEMTGILEKYREQLEITANEQRISPGEVLEAMILDWLDKYREAEPYCFPIPDPVAKALSWYHWYANDPIRL